MQSDIAGAATFFSTRFFRFESYEKFDYEAALCYYAVVLKMLALDFRLPKSIYCTPNYYL